MGIGLIPVSIIFIVVALPDPRKRIGLSSKQDVPSILRRRVYRPPRIELCCQFQPDDFGGALKAPFQRFRRSIANIAVAPFSVTKPLRDHVPCCRHGLVSSGAGSLSAFSAAGL